MGGSQRRKARLQGSSSFGFGRPINSVALGW